MVLAQDMVLAALQRRLRARLGGLRLGDPMDPKTEVGPLAPGTPAPEEVVQEAREEGAEVRRHRGAGVGWGQGVTQREGDRAFWGFQMLGSNLRVPGRWGPLGRV